MDEMKISILAVQLRQAAGTHQFMIFPSTEMVKIAEFLDICLASVAALRKELLTANNTIREMDAEILDWETRASDDGSRVMAEIYEQMGWK